MTKVVKICRDLIGSVVDGLLRHGVEDVLDGLHVMSWFPRTSEPSCNILTNPGLKILRRIREELSK